MPTYYLTYAADFEGDPQAFLRGWDESMSLQQLAEILTDGDKDIAKMLRTENAILREPLVFGRITSIQATEFGHEFSFFGHRVKAHDVKVGNGKKVSNIRVDALGARGIVKKTPDGLFVYLVGSSESVALARTRLAHRFKPERKIGYLRAVKLSGAILMDVRAGDCSRGEHGGFYMEARADGDGLKTKAKAWGPNMTRSPDRPKRGELFQVTFYTDRLSSKDDEIPPNKLTIDGSKGTFSCRNVGLEDLRDYVHEYVIPLVKKHRGGRIVDASDDDQDDDE